jgi:hypothetical protein
MLEGRLTVGLGGEELLALGAMLVIVVVDGRLEAMDGPVDVADIVGIEEKPGVVGRKPSEIMPAAKSKSSSSPPFAIDTRTEFLMDTLLSKSFDLSFWDPMVHGEMASSSAGPGRTCVGMEVESRSAPSVPRRTPQTPQGHRK